MCSFWPAKHLSDVLTEVGEETWISSNSGCCPGCTTAKQEPLTNIGSRSTPDRHQKSTPGKICISHPLLKENSVCVRQQRGDLVFSNLGFFYFPSWVFSPPIHWGAGGGCFIPPNQPKCTSDPTAMYFNAVNCIAVLCSPYCNLLNNYPLDIVLTIVVNPMQ